MRSNLTTDIDWRTIADAILNRKQDDDTFLRTITYLSMGGLPYAQQDKDFSDSIKHIARERIATLKDGINNVSEQHFWGMLREAVIRRLNNLNILENDELDKIVLWGGLSTIMVKLGSREDAYIATAHTYMAAQEFMRDGLS